LGHLLWWRPLTTIDPEDSSMRRRQVVSGLFATAVATAGLGARGSAASAASPDAERVRATLAGMTLAQKVGQLFTVSVFGDSATAPSAADAAANQALYGADAATGAAAVAKYHVGGVIYFTGTHNLSNPQQIAALSNGLQQSALSTGDAPLFLSTDQEGGIITRIGAPAAVSPGNMAIGATFSPFDAYRAAAVTGAELRAMGINVDHAPVVDVNTNPHNAADGVRAFGDRSATVARFTAAAVLGYQGNGVAAQAKHFPGLGDTTVNTDNGIAVTNETRQQILTTHIPPFAAAILAGIRSIMVGHVVAPALDPTGAPASLSRPIVTGLLRGTLRFDGVVVTDALNAGALASIPRAQVVLDAINAGVDVLLLPPDPAGAIAAVLDAVAAGTLSEARVDQSVARILRMKARLGLFADPYTTADRVTATVGTADHLRTMADIARRSITLLRNDAHRLPIAPSPDTHVLVTGWGVSTTQTLTNNLAGTGLTATRLWTGSPSQAVIDQAVAAARSNDVTVVTTNNVWNDATQVNLVNALLATGKPIVVVPVTGPYDLASFPSAPTYVAAYDYQPVSLAALTEVLVGGEPTGRLPVTVRSLAGDQVLLPYGSGLGYSAE
jgi:beta-N-acetylhexosaminidase